MGNFEFTVVPEDNSLWVATVWRPPLARGIEHHDRFTQVEWVAWSRNSRRPYILCDKCGKRTLRGFLSTDEPFGALYCHRCAGVRYRSQAHLRPIDRLSQRLDEIRTRLGGAPCNGEVGEPVPAKPLRMHWHTYDRLVAELMRLEGELAEAKEHHARVTMKETYAFLERTLAKIERWEQYAGRKRS